MAQEKERRTRDLLVAGFLRHLFQDAIEHWPGGGGELFVPRVQFRLRRTLLIGGHPQLFQRFAQARMLLLLLNSQTAGPAPIRVERRPRESRRRAILGHPQNSDAGATARLAKDRLVADARFYQVLFHQDEAPDPLAVLRDPEVDAAIRFSVHRGPLVNGRACQRRGNPCHGAEGRQNIRSKFDPSKPPHHDRMSLMKWRIPPSI